MASAAAGLLQQIMPLAGLAIWEARTDPLELIALDAGRAVASPFALDAAQLRPGAPWTDSVYPPDREKVLAFAAGSAAAQGAHSVDYRLIVGEGELLWIRHWVLSQSAAAGGRRRLQGLLMAIPEQKHLEWECLRVSERECNRIGQELHDDLCQVLAGLTFMMRVLGQRAAQFGPEFAAEVAELNRELIGATDRVRSMAHGLFPAQLNYGTLRHALNEFARQTRTRFPIELGLEVTPKLPPHTPEQIIHVYRIAQEAVSNSVRHGHATAIRVHVAANGRGVQMTISDNGKGLPATSARPEGIGMHAMQYRARMLGGELNFRNLSPQGVAVELTYPNGAAPVRRTPKNTRHA